MAAYNCGDACVKNAIKAAGGQKNFWKLASMPPRNKTNKHLPLETREYIPKVIARKLVAENPEKYGIEGVDSYVDPNLVLYHEIELDSESSFSYLSDTLNVERAVLEKLNPMYLTDFIPYDRHPLYIRIPSAGSEPQIDIL